MHFDIVLTVIVFVSISTFFLLLSVAVKHKRFSDAALLILGFVSAVVVVKIIAVHNQREDNMLRGCTECCQQAGMVEAPHCVNDCLALSRVRDIETPESHCSQVVHVPPTEVVDSKNAQ